MVMDGFAFIQIDLFGFFSSPDGTRFWQTDNCFTGILNKTVLFERSYGCLKLSNKGIKEFLSNSLILSFSCFSRRK